MKALKIEGEKFGRLLVLKRVENSKENRSQWLCRCECGNILKVRGISLRIGNTKSCGCLNRDTSAKIGKQNKGQRIGRKNPNWQGGGKSFFCTNCGNRFFVPLHELNSRKRNGIYCSRKCQRAYLKEHKMSETQRKLHVNMRRSILYYIKNKNRISWIKLLGYNVESLKRHLEKRFSKGMTWGNYGKWHIDHIKPVSAFTFSSYTDIQFQQCWALENLQPLWAKENISKGGINRKGYRWP